LLAGLQDIDVNDWKRHTKYRGEYNLNHPVIINFWKVLAFVSMLIVKANSVFYVFSSDEFVLLVNRPALGVAVRQY